MKKNISVNVVNAPLIPWDDVKHFELNDLKAVKDRDISKLKNAIINEGFNFAIVIWADHRYVIDGAGRVRALLELEKEGWHIDGIPFFSVNAPTKEMAKYLVLQASSQHGAITQESFDLFSQELNLDDLLESINLVGIDISLEPEETEGGGSQPEGDPDELPEGSNDDTVQPVSMPGDVYEIGKHKLICGDSTMFDDFQKLMGDEKADMVFTDPPYNIGYVGKTKEALKIRNDSMSDSHFRQFLYEFYSNTFAFTKPGGPIYVCFMDMESINFMQAMRDAGWLLKQCIIWVKHRLTFGKMDYHYHHEPILYGGAPGQEQPYYGDDDESYTPPVDDHYDTSHEAILYGRAEGGKHQYYGGRKQTTIWEFDRPKTTTGDNKKTLHPTMKPVDLIIKALKNSSLPGGIVLDPFGGSGSTMVACEMAGRQARMIEIDPRFVDTQVERMREKFPALTILRNGVEI